MWRVLDRAIDWFMLTGGAYERLAADSDGFLKSRVFPGLWLDVQALLAGDVARVLSALGAGLAMPEHSQFVDRLARK